MGCQLDSPDLTLKLLNAGDAKGIPIHCSNVDVEPSNMNFLDTSRCISASLQPSQTLKKLLIALVITTTFYHTRYFLEMYSFVNTEDLQGRQTNDQGAIQEDTDT